MSISVKESLEHVSEVLDFFGIHYITAEVLRRGKNEKKLSRRKNVIIKLNLLLNDLCLLYCFEFKRKFKPNYNEYINAEISKIEESHSGSSKNNNANNKRTDNRNENEEYNDDNENGNDKDDEDCYNEELNENVNYFEELQIISPLVILLLEHFEYPRLYHLLKCNFQMAKELLLCVGFLIDAIKLFEMFDKQQPFYKLLFNILDNNPKNVSKKDITPNMEKLEKYELHHYINEAMLFLSNRPYDIEIFECKHFYNFLENLKKNIKETSPFANNADSEISKIMVKKNEEKEKEKEKEEEVSKEINEDDAFSINEFINYDYSKYQENFLNYYNKKKWESEKENCEGIDTEENNNFENDESGDNDNAGERMYTMEIIKNINKNCNILLQLRNKIFSSINQLQNYDNNRLILFHEFNDLISKYTEPHNIVINWNDSLKENYKIDKGLNKGKKIDLSDNLLFNVIIEDTEKEKMESRKSSESLSKRMESKQKTQQQQQHNFNNNNNNKINEYKNKTMGSEKTTTDDNEFLNDINFEFLNDRININEFYILNNISLYNKMIHIYKKGLNFFQYEKLRAVFWIWLQSLFPDSSLDYDEEMNKKKEKIEVNFNDISNNMFFFDNVAKTKDDDCLRLYVLNDLNDFEKNYKLLKEYLKCKGCTTGYNKYSGSDKNSVGNMARFECITKYVHNLHLEFDAFLNYKKKSKNLSDEVFVEFLDDKKKNIIIPSNVDKDDYTNLANVVHKHLISINKIKNYNPILNLSKIVEGIKKQNFMKTDMDIEKLEMHDWDALYTYHKKKRDNIDSSSGMKNSDFAKRCIINLTNNSKYRIYDKPSTYASCIFQYSDQFITNNDIYSFSENIFKVSEEFEDLIINKRNKCTHNFFHILDKVEKYMDCVAFNL